MEQHRSATRAPVWRNAKQVSYRIQEQFPIALAREKKQAIFSLRVIVGVDGKVEDCLVLNVAPSDKAQSPACKLMAKAQFDPALDASGQPMRSFYATSLTYEIPATNGF